MAEIPEDQNLEPLDLHRYLGVVRRRHIHFLVPLVLGFLAVWGASWVLPPQYKSTTLILVQQPSMPKNYVEPNVNDNLQDRLQSITQQILSRTRLVLIVDKLHLYAESRSKLTPDEKVEIMRKDIGIELVHDAHGDQITAFKVSYSARDPHVAQQVTSELTDLFITENQKVVQQESEDTTNFIGNQLEYARTNLAEQEAKVREFEGQHEGALPTQQASNLAILSGLQAQLQNEQDALNTARQQRIYFESLIEQYRGSHENLRTGDAPPTSLAAIEQDLDKLRAKLVDLSAHYTDRYPDVQRLKEQIAKTEKTRDDLIANAKSKGNDGKQPNDGAITRNVTEASQVSPVLQLQGQLQANQAEVANREQSITGLKARIAEYQARLNEEPTVQQQLAEITRGYDQSKTDYDELLKKKNESAMATSMEQMQQGERFTMLDPPSLPVKPDFPNRLKFCGIGLASGLGLGILVVCAFEFLDDRLHDEKDIRALLTMGVIAEIPNVTNSLDEQASKRKIAIGWVMAALVVGTVLTGSAFSVLRR